jgi:hypothetical protein
MSPAYLGCHSIIRTTVYEYYLAGMAVLTVFQRREGLENSRPILRADQPYEHRDARALEFPSRDNHSVSEDNTPGRADGPADLATANHNAGTAYEAPEGERRISRASAQHQAKLRPL